MSWRPPQTPAAWHGDPTGRFVHRWWDGHAWTATVSRDGVAVEDPVGVARGPVLGAHGGLMASSPAGGPRPTRSRVGLVVALVAVVVVAVAAVLIVAAGDDSSSSAGGGTPTSEVATTAIGPDGGRVVIPESDQVGAGVTLEVPAGALHGEKTLTLSASPGRVGGLVDLADNEPDVWSALADYALDDNNTLVHPVFGPLVLASLTEFTGPVINFGPSGLELDRPAEVVVPLELVDLPEGTVPVVLLEGVGGWEVIDGATVDRTRGELRFEITHFSRSFIGRILGNVLSNPTASATSQQYQQALETLSAGPAEDVSDGVLRAILCREGISFNAAAVPDASGVLDYLGFESGRISRAPAGAESRIKGVLQTRFETARAAGNPAPHDFSLDMLVELALTETGGDPFQALVLAHDVLRDNRDLPSVQNVMANVRGDSGDERGARYHLLGTAIYSFAYEHLRATEQTGTFWPPRPETVVRWEEAWVSGDIRTDTVEYAVDRLGARLGRDLYREYAAITAGQRSPYVGLLCAKAAASTTSTTTTSTTSTTTPSTTSTTTTSTPPTSTVPPDIVLGTGDVQGTLIWSGDSDMDLHIVEPDGEETFYSSPSSSTGALLDHDDIPGCGIGSGDHVENIFWPQGQAPQGEYRAYVNFYTACAEAATQSVQLTVRVNGQVVISQAITLTGSGATSDLFLFTVS